MTRLAHVGGELVPAESASVSIRDRGFLYGDAVFETLRAYGGEPFAWDRHMERLAASAELIGLSHGLAAADLRRRVAATLEANELVDAYIRLSVTRGVQPGRLTPETAVDPTVVIIVEPLPRGGLDGDAVWDAPATCTVSDVERIPNAAIPAAAKTHNYLNGILARLAAREASADEALMCDGDGYLTEGATTNLFFVADGTLQTPTVFERPVLPGITRETVIELAVARDIPTAESAVTPADLHAADEAFLTNTTWEIRPIVGVDETSFEPGPITDRLMTAFAEYIEETYYDAETDG